MDHLNLSFSCFVPIIDFEFISRFLLFIYFCHGSQPVAYWTDWTVVIILKKDAVPLSLRQRWGGVLWPRRPPHPGVAGRLRCPSYPSVPAIRGRAGLRRQRHGPDTPRPRGEGPSRSCWSPPPRLWDPHILLLQPGCGPPAQVPSDPPTRLSTALGSAGDARLQMVQPGC